MTPHFQVVEIFDSVEGEGRRAGASATFIRLAGCNLRCAYCDTPYALERDAGQRMALADILAQCNRRLGRITLTGGEPLAAPHVEALVEALRAEGFEVNIETNGSVDLGDFGNRDEGLFFTVDYKLPSSGDAHRAMRWENYLCLKPWDVVKFVVGGDADVAAMAAFMRRLRPAYGEAPLPQFFAGVVHGAYDLQALVHHLLAAPELAEVRLQLQLHKIIWDADARGV